jgi:outer membrane protein OmpA-like peptidoglycan-associated protein
MKLVIFAATCLLASSLHAQMLGRAAPTADASVNEMVQALTPAPAGKTRGMRNIKVTPSKLDLTVNFEFGSAQLQAESKPLLQRLASAMNNDALRGLRFEIQGHTDAKGTASYNNALSQRRAQAVLNFLAENNVSRLRLESVGKGFNELLDPQEPLSALNRRVRVLTLE